MTPRPSLRTGGMTAPALFLCLGLAWLLALPVSAREKGGMPDLAQIEQTCLPTSTANLILWFGKHGYPKLIASGDTEDDRNQHTVHRIMEDTDARFDWGTRMDNVTIGIKKYIQNAGYDCDVEYRGLEGKAPFAQDWLKENDDPNKGFVLLLAYYRYDRDSDTFVDAWNAGHAVTLVNAEPEMLLIHDPAHYDDQTGRKIITPQSITSGYWQARGLNVSVSGLLLLSGSLLEAPPDSGVMLTGAVCITMHPAHEGASASLSPQAAPNATIAGTDSGAPLSTPKSPAPPASTSTSWAMWLFNLWFRK
jgi:hypothetical protein